jgi:hypothetical protein
MIKVGSGIHKVSGRPVKVMLDSAGGYWLCENDVDVSRDLLSQGCIPHRDSHQG